MVSRPTRAPVSTYTPHWTTAISGSARTARLYPAAGALAVFVALVIAAFASSSGLGVSPDSTQYLSTAEHIARGEGFMVHWWAEGSVPQTHFPPLLPLLLAGFARLGVAPVEGARFLNALALAASVLLTLRMARVTTQNSHAAAVAAAFGVALARDVQEVHAMAWSEPLFIALSLGALTLTARSLTRGSDRWAAAAGLLTGAAMLTRYAGGGLALATVIAPLVVMREPYGVRLRRSVVIGAAAGALLLPWLLRNTMIAGSATSRELAFHPDAMMQLRFTASTILHWLVPRRLGSPSALVVMAGMTAAGLLFLSVSARTSELRRDAPEWRQAYAVRRLLGLYIITTIIFFAFSLTFADAQTVMEPRLLAPLIPVAVILATSELHRAWKQTTRHAAARFLAAVTAVALVASLAEWLVDARTRGLGYNATSWRASALLKEVRGLPGDVAIYSNHPAAILFLTGREAIGLPRVADPTSLKANPAFAAEMRLVCARAGQRPTVLAYFFTEDQYWFLPSLAQLRRSWNSAPQRVTADGVLDAVPGGCATG